jgi:hypothetical protein
MKRLFVLSFVLFSFSLFAQPIDYETVGNTWNWGQFGQGSSGSFSIVANPSKTGLNTSDSCAMLTVSADAQTWTGVYFTDFPDLLLDSSNCIVKILVYKDVTSRFNLKLEPPNIDWFDSNTVVNQWEELSYDYTAHIGTTVATLTVIPDHEAGSRTHASVNYWDNIRFTPIAPIPVELASFSASIIGDGIKLEWSTATETNNRGFEIQRGTNNRDLTTVAFVNGNGTTTEKQNYNYIDTDRQLGTVYYRLKQIDFNGSYEYSKVVEVTKAISYALAQNYPNPFNPITTITYSIPQNSFVTLKVYNVLGSEVAELVNGQVEAGVHKVNFNGFDLNSGVYFYTIKAGNFSETKKLMLMK